MTTVDLITGFLGSGKTTFMKRYVRYLLKQGHNVCILENDFGAVNVDTMLLRELCDEGCGLEMVSGACDKHCHRRRFKTKLIAMAMSGYDRVVIEPSGVFDVDEFFDTLRESPLDRMYSCGSVITIVDPTLTGLSERAYYLLSSQAAVAGTILFSHINDNEIAVSKALERIKSEFAKMRCDRDPFSYYLAKPWSDLDDDDLSKISSSGWHEASFIKQSGEQEGYGSVYYLNNDLPIDRLREIACLIINDSSCGVVLRIKGFTLNSGQWYELNVTKHSCEVTPVKYGQSVFIVIGESLKKDVIDKYITKEIYQ